MFDLASMSAYAKREFFVERYVFHNDRMWDLYRQNKMSKSRLRKARFEAALQDIHVNDKRLAKLLGEAYLEICPRKKKLNEGALQVVQALSKNHVLHILSNGFHETQHIKLRESGLAPYFSEVITSERAGARKPNYGIFAFAERLTSAAKSHSMMVGDDYNIDIKGAIDFGWKAIHYNPNADESKDSATIKYLPQLLEILKA